MSNTKARKYDGFRVNQMCSQYSEIAVNHYMMLKKQYNEMLKVIDIGYEETTHDYIAQSIRHHTVICTVFSAMAIEAFFNDYLAGCLGDRLFLGSFDQLSPISKFHLIAEMIICDDSELESVVHSDLKAIFKERDNYVHSKSITPEDAEKIKYYEKNSHVYIANDAFDIQINKEFLVYQLNKGKSAIRALRDVMRYFSNYDDNKHARYEFFPFITHRYRFEYEELVEEFELYELVKNEPDM